MCIFGDKSFTLTPIVREQQNIEEEQLSEPTNETELMELLSSPQFNQTISIAILKNYLGPSNPNLFEIIARFKDEFDRLDVVIHPFESYKRALIAIKELRIASTMEHGQHFAYDTTFDIMATAYSTRYVHLYNVYLSRITLSSLFDRNLEGLVLYNIVLRHTDIQSLLSDLRQIPLKHLRLGCAVAGSLHFNHQIYQPFANAIIRYLSEDLSKSKLKTLILDLPFYPDNVVQNISTIESLELLIIHFSLVRDTGILKTFINNLKSFKNKTVIFVEAPYRIEADMPAERRDKILHTAHSLDKFFLSKITNPRIEYWTLEDQSELRIDEYLDLNFNLARMF